MRECPLVERSLLERVPHGTALGEGAQLDELRGGLDADEYALRDESVVENRQERRIDADDPYFRDLGRRWSEALAAAHRAMPDPTWLDLQTPPAAKTMMIAS